MTENIDTSKERNKDYFKSLIATRASMGMLGVSGFVGSILTGLIYYQHSNTVIYYGVNPPHDLLSQLLIFGFIFSIVTLLSLVIEPIRHILFKRQRFSSVLQVLSVFILYFSLALMTSFMILIDGYMVDIYGSPVSVPLLLVDISFYLLCVLYNVRWLRTEVTKGMSEERTQKNFLAKSAITSPASLLLILGLTMVVPLFIRDWMDKVLGLSLFILFTSAFSRLHVEYAYAAVLKWRDKEYWEEYRREDGIIIPKKKWLSMVRLLIEIGCFSGIVYIRGNLLPAGHPMRSVLRILVFGILIYWMIRFILWRWKNRGN